jgi:hypothetical protein
MMSARTGTEILFFFIVNKVAVANAKLLEIWQLVSPP